MMSCSSVSSVEATMRAFELHAAWLRFLEMKHRTWKRHRQFWLYGTKYFVVRVYEVTKPQGERAVLALDDAIEGKGLRMK